MGNTPRLSLPYIAQGQAQKEVTHNDALNTLDALVDLYLLDRYINTPPSDPADGDAYITGDSPTGAWSGHTYKIATVLDGGWRFFDPFKGLRAYVADEGVFVIWDGSSWVDWSSTLTLNNVPSLGIGTTADETNKLAVRSDAAYVTTDTGDVRVSVNKSAAGNTASFVFQDNWSGRAEVGLTGDDDFHFKVSPDGSSWTDAIKISKSDGGIVVPAIGINATPISPLTIASDGVTTDAVIMFNTHPGAASWRFGVGTGGFSFGFYQSSDAIVAGGFGSDGSLLLGTTTNGGWMGDSKLAVVGASHVISAQVTGNGTAIVTRADNTGAWFGSFYFGTTNVGSIAPNGTTGVVYNTTSDARLKTVLAEQADYRAAIKSLWVGDFTWNESGARGFGVLAQQAWEVMPNHQGVTRPANDDDPWGASAEPFAHLALWGVKDIYALVEELTARIAALEARIAALEAGH